MSAASDGVSWRGATVFSVVRDYCGRLEASGFLTTEEGSSSFTAYRYPNGEYHLTVSSHYPAVPGISRRMGADEVRALGGVLAQAKEAGQRLGQPHALDAMLAAIRAAVGP